MVPPLHEDFPQLALRQAWSEWRIIITMTWAVRWHSEAYGMLVYILSPLSFVVAFFLCQYHGDGCRRSGVSQLRSAFGSRRSSTRVYWAGIMYTSVLC